jgi:long-subunit fatty acid transport protein
LDDYTILNRGDVRYIYRGEGGINRVILNTAYAINKNLSLGLSTQYYFGSLNRYYNLAFLDDPTYSSQLNYTKTNLSDFAVSLGLQYYKKWKGKNLTFGATYQPRQKMSTKLTQLSTIESDILMDTVGSYSETKASSYLPHQLSAGVTLSATDRWLVGMDVEYAGWKHAALLGDPGILGDTYTVRMGGSYTPNRYDVRYFSKRMTYRGGVRYGVLPVVINGQRVTDMAVSIGLGIPFRTRSVTFLNLSAEYGMRGKTSNGMLKENYFSIAASFTFWDRWFLKYKFD